MERGNKKEWWSKYKTRYFVCMAVITCLLAYILKDNYEFIANVFLGVALSVFAGLILGVYIDVPNMVKNYKDTMLNILTSNEYLRELDTSRLAQLRESTTSILYSVPNNYEPGLILLDKEICSLLTHPYYDWYRQTIVCEKADEDGNVLKHVEVDYGIKSPNNDSNVVFNEDIGVRIFTHKVQGRNQDELVTIKQLSYKVDGGEWVYLKKGDFVNFVKKCDYKKDNTYPLCITISSNKDRFVPIIKSFKQSLEVKISYDTIIAAMDKTFCKRLRHPTKSFILNYSVKDTTQKLHGELLGTLVDVSDFSIIGNETNTVFLESRKWMLPKNGAVIMIM